MQEKIAAFEAHVRQAAADPSFVHHKWFVKWHLEVVERITFELASKYPQADRDLLAVMVWLHDYGKIIDFVHEYETTLTAGRQKLSELDFEPAFIDKAIGYIETLDKKLEIDLRRAPIEVQIVSSADGCAHLTGPFMYVFWHEATDQTFKDKTLEELMRLNLAKAHKDWTRKIVLPEASQAFEARYKHMCELSGELPERFLS